MGKEDLLADFGALLVQWRALEVPNFMQANVYFDEGDLENALVSIKKAYKCKNGSINGMVLLNFAIILSKMGISREATVYVFAAISFSARNLFRTSSVTALWKR